MSKTFVFKRNRSEDVWRPVQHTPTARRKSLSRERKSLSPTKSLYQSEFPLHASLANAHTVQSPSPSPRRTSQSVSPQRTRRHRDLKRKFIFQLHEEIKKPSHTTTLEEISDIETITSICFTTLHAMMENKHQRKFLHHMNNTHNNSSTNNNIQLDKTSNSKYPKSSDEKRQKLLEDEMFKSRRKTIGKLEFTSTSIKPPEGQKPKQEVGKQIQMTSTMRQTLDASKKYGGKRQVPFLKPHPITGRQGRPRKMPVNLFPKDGSWPGTDMKPGPSNPGHVTSATQLQQLGKEAAIASGGVNQPRNPTIRFTEEMTKFLAVADQNGPNANTKKDEEFKQKEEMTPLQALYCPWLRLTKEQVLVLEKLCRDEGIDPGIHAHVDVTEMDIFEEIRNKKDTKNWKSKLARSRSNLDESSGNAV